MFRPMHIAAAFVVPIFALLTSCGGDDESAEPSESERPSGQQQSSEQQNEPSQQAEAEKSELPFFMTDPEWQPENLERVAKGLDKPALQQTSKPVAMTWTESEGRALLTLPGDVQMPFVWIPAGSFIMGGRDFDPEAMKDEFPQHEVVFARGFWMSATEVTQGQWNAVWGNPPPQPSRVGTVGENLPVLYISWNDCQDFVAKMNASSGGAFRLPSEAEWEYACRAGTNTVYHFGDDPAQLDAYAWYSANSQENFHPVAQKKPNPWGLYDMYGNVDENCQDWYHDNYVGAPSDGSAWEEPATNSRVVRGGANVMLPKLLRSACRIVGLDPNARVVGDGFRLCRAPSQ